MAYILDVMNGVIEPQPNRISLEKYVVENGYITKYLARVVRDKALAVYHVLFHLSYFETGRGELAVPWLTVGSYIVSDQGRIVKHNSTIKRRLKDLVREKCITISRTRTGPNEIYVHLPSEIAACKKLMKEEESREQITPEEDKQDYFTDPARRLEILIRDRNRCMYCRVDLSEDTFALDHLVPTLKGGTNQKNNLVAACGPCNSRRGDMDILRFLKKNYRSGLLSQEEFLTQKTFIEKLLAIAL